MSALLCVGSLLDYAEEDPEEGIYQGATAFRHTDLRVGVPRLLEVRGCSSLFYQSRPLKCQVLTQAATWLSF
jgi:hypothetical protein